MAIETRILQGKNVFDGWEVKEYIGSGSGGKTAVFRIARGHGDWEESAALKVINILEEIGKKETLAEIYLKEYEDQRNELCEQAEDEIHLMSRLRGNPHIVDYYDFCLVDYQEENVFGTDLLIRMELLQSLRDERKTKGEYEEEEIIKIGRDICKGLSFCHNTGIIHRDIKPGNIFVNAYGDYKLGDFGIARMVDAGQKASTKMGTRAYAAPEQFMSHKDKYDKRVDIYSLGLTLYELSNHNRLPFASSGYVRESEISQRLLGKEFPAPESANPALAAVIKKACAFRPEDRYASVEELEEALMAAEVGVLSERDKASVKKVVNPLKTKPEKKREKAKKRTGYFLAGAVGILFIVLMLLAFAGISKALEASDGTEPVWTPQETPELSENEKYEQILGTAAYVTMAGDTTAVITRDGDLYMWGKNENGQLGCGDTRDRTEPTLVMGSVASVYLSEIQSAALTTEGNLYVWGTTESWSVQLTPKLILSDVKEASLGYLSGAALCHNGDLYGWGAGDANGIGHYVSEPTLIAKDIVSFSKGAYGGGAVNQDGELYMWGDNSCGQVGNGTAIDQLTPVKIMDDVKSVCMGQWTSAAIKTNGDLYVWGDSRLSQTGTGIENGSVCTPILVLTDVKSVFLEYNYSAAITNSGVLYMWGVNDNSQLGVPGHTRYSTPQKVCAEVETVVLGERHTGIIRTNGDLYLCGTNDNRQINDSELNQISAPVLVERDIVSVSCGWKSTYAVGSDGSFYSWGD